MIIEMGGNPHAILAALADKRKFEPSGEPSLQNGLDMARSSMGCVDARLADGIC
jgi:transcription initiation factor TFIIH subunit 2